MKNILQSAILLLSLTTFIGCEHAIDSSTIPLDGLDGSITLPQDTNDNPRPPLNGNPTAGNGGPIAAIFESQINCLGEEAVENSIYYVNIQLGEKYNGVIAPHASVYITEFNANKTPIGDLLVDPFVVNLTQTEVSQLRTSLEFQFDLSILIPASQPSSVRHTPLSRGPFDGRVNMNINRISFDISLSCYLID